MWSILISILIVLLVFALIYYVIDRLLPFDEGIKRLVLAVVAVIFVLWLLGIVLGFAPRLV